MIKTIIEELEKTEHGFKHIQEAGDDLMRDKSLDHFKTAMELLDEESYQARMLGTHLLGLLSPSNTEALTILRDRVALDPNWRVQEMLAKAFDHYCSTTGYEKALPVVREWLDNANPNVKRAVTEGLRIWTGRPYFKTHPQEAVTLIAAHKADESEYLRKSVGNALRDISRKHADLVGQETETWNLSDPKVAFTLKLVKNRQ